MEYLKTVKAAVVFFVFTTVCVAENYTVSLYFEQTENALSTLFRTQAFPHPIGDHNGDDYDIYIWNPTIDIEPGYVNFIFTIYADVVINGVPTQYTYPFNIPSHFSW